MWALCSEIKLPLLQWSAVVDKNDDTDICTALHFKWTDHRLNVDKILLKLWILEKVSRILTTKIFRKVTYLEKDWVANQCSWVKHRRPLSHRSRPGWSRGGYPRSPGWSADPAPCTPAWECRRETGDPRSVWPTWKSYKILFSIIDSILNVFCSWVFSWPWWVW